MTDEVRLIDELINRQTLLNEISALNPVDYGSISNYEGHACARDILYDVKRIIESLPNAIMSGIDLHYDNPTPCTFCMYSPPSSGDGKPCTMCPAAAKGE